MDGRAIHSVNGDTFDASPLAPVTEWMALPSNDHTLLLSFYLAYLPYETFGYSKSGANVTVDQANFAVRSAYLF